MQSDVLRLLTVAMAVSVSQDLAAYEMLQTSFINGFKQYYRQKTLSYRRQGATNDPIYLDELIKYAIEEIPNRLPGAKSLAELDTEAKKAEIKHRFLTESLSHMLASLARRDTVKDSIAQILHTKDKHKNHRAISSSRINLIFTDFMDMFERSCTRGFEFEGSFLTFVSYCFTMFYYENRKTDIWRSLRSPDFAKKEAETSISTVKVLTAEHKNNLPIHDLVINIVALNDLVFSHSGQSDDAYGICYDSYYLILNYLCESRVEAINKTLTGIKLRFVDIRDRKKSRPGYSENKSIASKIANEKELLPYPFECFRQESWNLDNIMELRDHCFLLGKKDRDGKNCVWKDVQERSETCQYLNRTEAIHNYWAFDLIFKGVMSIYTLMKAIEERGYNLVEFYPPLERVFSDKAISRDITSLYDLEHLDLIVELQSNPPDESINHGDLSIFPKMVHDYAGSEDNKKDYIHDNRYNAELRGLLDNPLLKQRGPHQTPFTQLFSAAEYMTSIPRSYEEYVNKLLEIQLLPPTFGYPVDFQSVDISHKAYCADIHNKFLISDAEAIDYYLYGREAKGSTNALDWHIGTALTSYCAFLKDPNLETGLYQNHFYGMFVPMVGRFIIFDTVDPNDPDTKYVCATLPQLEELEQKAFYDKVKHINITVGFDMAPSHLITTFLTGNKRGLESYRKSALSRSMGFDSFLGYRSLFKPELEKSFKAIKVYQKYQSSVERYVQWMNEIGDIQLSMVDLLQSMFSYGYYLVFANDNNVTEEEREQGRILINSLLHSEFTEENLTWFFNTFESLIAQYNLAKINFIWSNRPTNRISFTSLDISCMDILTGKVTETENEDSWTYELVKALSNYHTTAQRFIMAYNFLDTSLNFLRLLRDAYDLLFQIIPKNISTFACELNSRFHIEEIIEGAKTGMWNASSLTFTKTALLDTLSSESISRYITDTRFTCWQSFSVLCDDLVGYFDNCRKEISSLVDYEVVKSDNLQSEFQEFGSVFNAAGPYNNDFVLSLFYDLRARGRTDDAGFIRMKNSYLKGNIGDTDYYIHSTGRILEARGGNIRPHVFNFSDDADCSLYREIIRSAKEQNVW